MWDIGRRLYTDSCTRNGVKPNRDIMQQVDRVDLMNLQSIDASHTFLGCLGVHALLDFVCHHSCIESLLLPQNGVEAECVEHLCRIVRDGHPRLAYIDLSRNPLSTPSIRLLWDAACSQPTLVSVNTTRCGVSEDWYGRLQRVLEANMEFKCKGYFPYGPERPLLSWHTVFVLLLGDVARVKGYCSSTLSAVASYAAPLRLRVAPMVVATDDSLDRVRAKVRRCRDPTNGNLTWCVVILSQEAALGKTQRQALELVLQETQPLPPPLHSKLGVLRGPVQRCAQARFVYAHLDADERRKHTGDVLAPRGWLRMAGFHETQLESLCATVTLHAKLVTKDSIIVQCQSDLTNSLKTVFSEAPDRMGSTTVATITSAVTLDRPEEGGHDSGSREIQRRVEIGNMHPKKCMTILKYIDDRDKEIGVPLVIYGAGDVGKGEMLTAVAHKLRGRADHTTPEEEEEGREGVSSRGQLRIVTCNVDVNYNSVVVFLYRMLGIFLPGASLEFSSMASLANTVRDAIQSYKGADMVLLVSHLDALDTCGHSCSTAADWLPHSFPGQLRIVVSLNTESPILPLIRKRSPQPYECLVSPIAEPNRIHLYRYFLSERQVTLPGLDERDMRARDAPTLPESAYLQHEGSGTSLYPFLAASHTDYLLSTNVTIDSECAAADFLAEHLPDTVEELLREMCVTAEACNSAEAVRCVLTCLAVAPLPVPELLYVCEELGPCEEHTTLPSLLHLVDIGLVWYANSTAHIAHRTIRSFVLKYHADLVDRISVLVENHLHRLVATRSAEAASSFRHLVRVMVSNGTFVPATQLLLSSVVMDFILGKGREEVLYVIDAYFRLLAARDVLMELELSGEPVKASSLDDETLHLAMRDVQRWRSNLFQSSLLDRNWSPFARDARDRVRAGACPYTVVEPINTGTENQSTTSLTCEGMLVQCHGRGDYFVTTTSDTVIVFDMASHNEIARLTTPFEKDQKILGSLMASGTRVAVMGAEKLLIWDFECDSLFLFDEMTASACVSAMDSFGTSVIAVHTATQALCLVDITRKVVLHELPTMDASAATRSAIFSGNHVLLLTVCDLYLFDEELTESIRLQHDGPIRAMSSNSDGRLIASSVGAAVWVWTSTGDLLHRLDAGLTPITRLCFDGRGALLISHQAEGVKLWRTVTGTHVATLAGIHKQQSVLQCLFTEDSARIVCCTGMDLLVWDAQTIKPLGAFSADFGVFTSIQELNNIVLAAMSTGDVRAFDLCSAIPSLHQAAAGSITSNWLRNAKVSEHAITSVSVNAASTFVVSVDARQHLHIYSLATGQSLQQIEVGPTRCALAIGLDAVARVPEREAAVRILSLRTLTEVVLRFPREAVEEAEVQLYKSPDEKLLAATYFYLNNSRLFVYDLEKQSFICQFNGHLGRIIFVTFSGSFVYTVGDDGCVRLWTLTRMAERAGYAHPLRIVAATCDSAGMLLCMDSAGDMFRVHVDNIASSTRAVFSLTQIPFHGATRRIVERGVVAMLVVSDIIIFTMAEGSVIFTNLDREGHLNDISTNLGLCRSMCAYQRRPSGAWVLITGLASGCVLASSIHGPDVKQR